MSKANFIAAALSVGVVVFATSWPTNAAEAFSAECAAHDLRLVSSIEENGDAGTIPSDKLAAAYVSLLEARQACRTGKVADALRAYGSITITSVEAAAQPAR